MPLVEVTVFEHELDTDQSKDLTRRITDAVTAVTSEKLRDVTWVIVHQVKDGHWSVGGKVLGLDDVKTLMVSS